MTLRATPKEQRLNQFALLSQRRFGPFFWTQLSGAANDNLFKFALTVLLTYQLQLSWLKPETSGLVIGALFILPFVLFSATSGQLADKYDKQTLMRAVKWLEVGIMALACIGFYTSGVTVLLVCIFLMGVHSTIFGPAKYAYLPQHLSEQELTGGNGMVEMGTFVAIVLGNVLGGLLVAIPGVGGRVAGLCCLALALIGRLAAQWIPRSPSADPRLTINWNPFTETWRNLRLAKRDPTVFRALLAISWMWFFGAVFLSLFPGFAKALLHGDEQVAAVLLVAFSLGIGTGSLLCETLSRGRVELGLVPLGALGMTIFSVDLYFASRGLPPVPLQSITQFLALPAHWRVVSDLFLLALSAGLYSVPLYALMQLRTQASHRARVVAANNILNALFMVVSAGLAGALLGAGLTIAQVFLAVGLANLAVTGTVFLLTPEYIARFKALFQARSSSS